MRPMILFFVAAMLMPLLCLASAAAQCPGGVCPTQPSYSAPQYTAPATRQPARQPATQTRDYNFRYVANSQYASVVQIVTEDGGRTRSKGSGVLVRWGGRLLVLTARHVIRDAKSVVVRILGGKNRRARVVVADPTWDCAVLDIGQDDPGVTASEMGSEIPRLGEALTTVGFGGNDRMAANTGRVLGFKFAGNNSSAADWCEIRGPARQGDSGGPVFNAKKQVVGVLWGTDNRTTVAVQLGRVGVCLNAAAERLGPLQKTAAPQVALGCGILRRQPTPAVPPPNVIVQSDPAVGRALQGIERNTTPPAVQPSDEQAAKQDPKGLPPWLIAVLIGGGAVVGLVAFYAVGKN